MRLQFLPLAPIPRKVRFTRGFTLVELLVCVAIASTLVLLALPAYQSYVLRSRFSEVEVATNPIKAAIASCAADGSCVSNNQLVLDLSRPSTVISATIPDQVNIPSNLQQAYAYLVHEYAQMTAAGETPYN